MAILHRNPMPMSGALFVTNPRRNKSGKSLFKFANNPLSKRRNALARKRNKKNPMFKKGKFGALRINKAGVAGTRKTGPVKTKTGRTMYYIDGILVSKEKYQQFGGVSGKAFASKRKAKTKAKVKGSARSSYRGMTNDQIIAELKSLGVVGYAGKKKSALKRMLTKARQDPNYKRTRKKGKRTGYSKFVKKMGGLGFNRAGLNDLYKKKKSAKELSKLKSLIKKGAKAKLPKKAGRALHRQAMLELKASQPALFNPLKKVNGRRKNPIFGLNILATPIQFIQEVQAKASQYPVVKQIAWAITPIALGAGVYAVHRFAEPKLMPVLDEYLGNVPVVNHILKYPYTTTGVVAGIALGVLAKYGFISPQAAGTVAASAATVGIGLDLSLRPLAKAASDVVAAEVIEESVAVNGNGNGMAGMHMAGAHKMGAIHKNPHCYGDGGQYMIGRDSTALGKAHYGAIKLGAVHLNGAHDSMYHDASVADAKATSNIMTPDEVAAAKAGKAAYARAFGFAPSNLSQQQSLLSRHAGRAGHRFGWIVKMVGFENFQKIASLPAQQRATVISQLQQQAIASIPALVAQQQQQNSSIESASIPVSGTMNGVQGFEGVGYGALMFAGSGY